jgi:hypothetical protein
VSGPGQKRSARRRANGGTSLDLAKASSAELQSRAIGLPGSRPFISNSRERPTYPATSPTTVSVGTSPTSPLRNDPPASSAEAYLNPNPNATVRPEAFR